MDLFRLVENFFDAESDECCENINDNDSNGDTFTVSK